MKKFTTLTKTWDLAYYHVQNSNLPFAIFHCISLTQSTQSSLHLKISFKFNLQYVPIFNQVVIRTDTHKLMYFSTPVYCTSDPPSFNHSNKMQIFRLFKYFLLNKTNRCSEFEFYWYYGSTCFGQPFCLSSGVLSRTSALVHFMQL